MADQCLFCRIVRKEISAAVVAETAECLAFRDITPKAPTHILVIPKTHVESLDAATDAGLVGRLALFAAELARTEGIAARGYRVVMNTNADGGQSVYHLHLHLLGGRTMAWPPG